MISFTSPVPRNILFVPLATAFLVQLFLQFRLCRHQQPYIIIRCFYIGAQTRFSLPNLLSFVLTDTLRVMFLKTLNNVSAGSLSVCQIFAHFWPREYPMRFFGQMYSTFGAMQR